MTMLRFLRSGVVWNTGICWVKRVNNTRYAVSLIYVCMVDEIIVTFYNVGTKLAIEGVRFTSHG